MISQQKTGGCGIEYPIEWPPCSSPGPDVALPRSWDDQGSGRQIGAESCGVISLNSTLFGTTTRRLAQLRPDGRPRRNGWAVGRI